MAKRYTDFPCPTCGWGYTHHCVKGKNGSDLWMKQIPRKDWHPARHNELKRRKGTLTQKD